MTPEFAYLLKVNVAFVLFYAFYRLFFYKDTFFKLRRAILLAFFGLALFLSFAEHPRLGKATRAYSRCDLYVFRYVA